MIDILYSRGQEFSHLTILESPGKLWKTASMDPRPKPLSQNLCGYSPGIFSFKKLPRWFFNVFPELGNNDLAQWSANCGSQAKIPHLCFLPPFLKKKKIEIFTKIFVHSHALQKLIEIPWQCAIFVNGNILQNCSIISQPGNWHQHSPPILFRYFLFLLLCVY